MTNGCLLTTFLNREINVNLTHINTKIAAVDKKQLKIDK
jgi:hypothetical protein